MLQRIGENIALQFTAMVFGLLLVNGVLFLAVERGNMVRQAHSRLERVARSIADRGPSALAFPEHLPPILRERLRIVDAQGAVVYAGVMFADIPFIANLGISNAWVDGESYEVLTQPILGGDGIIGYLQVADVQRGPLAELPFRALLYLAVSVAVSLLFFLVGSGFARRSLRPAEQTMQRLEQFTQDASHELRTPLAALSSSLDLALRSKKYEEGIVSAKEDLQQVMTLVERLLELTRLDATSVRLAPVSLSDTVLQAVEHMRPLAQKAGVAIEASIATGVTRKADPALVRQLVVNLVSNAIKFRGEAPVVRVALTRDVLRVSDNGAGIAAEHLPRLFDRFYQVDRSRSQGGFGLGLALVRRIVQLHKWAIEVESVQGTGTTFTVRFSRAV